MNGLFEGCASLKELNIFNFNDTNNKINFNSIFKGCPKELKNKFNVKNNNPDKCIIL